MRKTLNMLRFLRTYVALVRDPNQLQRVFALADRLAKGDLFERMPWLRGRPEIEALISDPAWRLRCDRARLSRLPPKTLGRQYADFLTHNGLEPDELDHSRGQSTLQRLRIHLESTHDVWHVVTGFDTDVAGELGLQAFYYAQLSTPLPLALISAGLLNGALMNKGPSSARVEQLARGYWMGRRAVPLTGIDWSEHWERPLDELRRKLRVDVALDVTTEASQPVAAARGFLS
ncbi:MAG: Coq4 family protein [Myxococcota bacterium]